MALAVLAAGALRAILPAQLRTADARWVLSLVLVVLLATLIVGDPGRIDRDSTWLRVTTSTLIGVISLANAAAVIRLVAAITIGQAKFTNDANVLLASGLGLRSTPGTPPASYPIAVHHAQAHTQRFRRFATPATAPLRGLTVQLTTLARTWAARHHG